MHCLKLWPYGVLPLLQARQRFPQSCPFPSAQRLPLEKTVRLPVPLSIISGAWLTDGEIIRSSDSSRHLNHCQPHICLARPFAFFGDETFGQIFLWHSICEQWKVWIPPCFHYFLSTHPPSFPPFAQAIPETLLRQKVHRSKKIYPNNVEHPHRFLRPFQIQGYLIRNRTIVPPFEMMNSILTSMCSHAIMCSPFCRGGGTACKLSQ